MSFFPVGSIPDHICNGIWIGNSVSACEKIFLKENRISVILNCAIEILGSGVWNGWDEIEYYHLLLEDDETNISNPKIKGIVLKGAEIIQHNIMKGKGILVHCSAGMNRSPCVVGCYVVKYQGMSDEDAIQTIRKVRPNTFISEWTLILLKEVYTDKITHKI